MLNLGSHDLPTVDSMDAQNVQTWRENHSQKHFNAKENKGIG